MSLSLSLWQWHCHCYCLSLSHCHYTAQSHFHRRCQWHCCTTNHVMCYETKSNICGKTPHTAATMQWPLEVIRTEPSSRCKLRRLCPCTRSNTRMAAVPSGSSLADNRMSCCTRTGGSWEHLPVSAERRSLAVQQGRHTPNQFDPCLIQWCVTAQDRRVSSLVTRWQFDDYMSGVPLG